MTRVVVSVVLLALVAAIVRADIYMHNPRGSNNRNCETQADRNNANRLFDSQNNDAGGYPCPRDHFNSGIATPTMYYYQGSILPIEWTNQHSCGYGNNDCQIVIQFACNDTLKSNARDGTPVNANDAATDRVDTNTYTNPRYGVHESMEYYQKCATRTRNNGLYIADQAIQNPGRLGANAPATATRQDSDQTRYGWECPEERDYYPYWHPSPWRDIAIFTSNPDNCTYYQKESQNVQSKGECWDTTGTKYLSFNNPQACNSNNGKWTVVPGWGRDPPQCMDIKSITVRDNHLGSVSTGQMAGYNWTIPDWIADEQCVLRIRYNISTADTPWYTDSNSNGAKALIVQNPYVDWGHGFPLQLAFNSDEGGRTFQDRSYIFAIRRRPPTIPSGATIYNINVRGKRGNIVDVFPSVEYDFVPNYLQVFGSDYVHFQWTGSDYNVDRNPNAANGGPQYPGTNGNTALGARSDRHNVVQLDKQALNVPRRAQYNTLFMNNAGQADLPFIYQMALLGQPVNATDPDKKCLTRSEVAQSLGVTNNIENNILVKYHKQNCGALNSASVYFDAGPVQLKASGIFHYFCSRNNAFSNRSQKGRLVVIGGIFSGASSLVPSTAMIALVSIAISLIAQLL